MSTASISAARRYIIVTAVATPANVLLTWALLSLSTLHPLWCNLISATTLTIPTFVACTTWVWPAAGPSLNNATAFWLSSLVNVGIASLAIWAVASSGGSDVLLALTPLGVYTALWIVRFVFLDRVLFGRARRPQAPASGVAPTTL